MKLRPLYYAKAGGPSRDGLGPTTAGLCTPGLRKGLGIPTLQGGDRYKQSKIHTHTHIYMCTHIHIYIYVYTCSVCKCVCMYTAQYRLFYITVHTWLLYSLGRLSMYCLPENTTSRIRCRMTVSSGLLVLGFYRAAIWDCCLTSAYCIYECVG